MDTIIELKKKDEEEVQKITFSENEKIGEAVINHPFDPTKIDIRPQPVKISNPKCHVYHREVNQKFYHNENNPQTIFGCVEQIQRFQKYPKPYTFDPLNELELRSGQKLSDRIIFNHI